MSRSLEPRERWGLVRWGLVRWGLVRWGLVLWGLVRWGHVRWGHVRWGLVLWGLGLILASCAPPSTAATPTAVVVLGRRLDDGVQRGGSGVIVSASGRVLTAHHVVHPRVHPGLHTEPKGELVVGVLDRTTRAPRFVGARLLRSDLQRDLALLELEGAPPAEGWPHLAPCTRPVAMGEEVTVWGWPFGPPIRTTGPVVAIRGDRAARPSLLGVAATAYPGSSGGPLLGAEGCVVGVSLAISSPWEWSSPLLMARAVGQVPDPWWSAAPEAQLDVLPELTASAPLELVMDIFGETIDEHVWVAVSRTVSGVVRSEPPVALHVVDGEQQLRSGMGEVACLSGDPETTRLLAVVPSAVERLRLELTATAPPAALLPRQQFELEVLLAPHRRELVRYVVRARDGRSLDAGEAAPGLPFWTEELVIGAAARVEVASGGWCAERALPGRATSLITITESQGAPCPAPRDSPETSDVPEQREPDPPRDPP